jgi:hypothetical protein
VGLIKLPFLLDPFVWHWIIGSSPRLDQTKLAEKQNSEKQFLIQSVKIASAALGSLLWVNE